ncbi:MAG: diadenylate cyclase CdaA [Phycisphaerales bacterium]|nr:MAG: diadenylate cyclase CdaA [Phycisphaerales bacterium]
MVEPSDWVGRWSAGVGAYDLFKVGLEMLLIAVVVYTTLRFLQGTRGARLMRAIGLIVVVSFLVVRLIAVKLELDRINYVYPYFLGAVFLITLIVFQTELRRGLLILGADWWSRAWAEDASRIVEPVVEAVASLSKKKVGALIAIERGVGMAGLAETGVQLDATVSADLLSAIYWPGSVLHDMGVIIRKGRIVAASCQFPLADSGDVDRSLGSRHRAAIGMSHESDALVIVVSEETGTISVAEHGRLRRSLTVDALRQILRTGLAPASGGLKRRLRKRAPAAPPAAPAARAAEPPKSADTSSSAGIPLPKAKAGT